MISVKQDPSTRPIDNQEEKIDWGRPASAKLKQRGHHKMEVDVYQTAWSDQSMNEEYQKAVAKPHFTLTTAGRYTRASMRVSNCK